MSTSRNIARDRAPKPGPRVSIDMFLGETPVRSLDELKSNGVKNAVSGAFSVDQIADVHVTAGVYSGRDEALADMNSILANAYGKRVRANSKRQNPTYNWVHVLEHGKIAGYYLAERKG